MPLASCQKRANLLLTVVRNQFLIPGRNSQGAGARHVARPMKITGINKLRPSAVRRKEAQAAAAGVGFADALREGAGPATTAAAAPVDTVGSLLVLQEVPDAAEGRAKALARGRDLLAEFEDIRHGLLIGALSTQRLQGLLGMVH
ncbi:MAG: hypothetical protein EXQ96_07995, partial [Alphaproteobacteria bacterium]|nr:hypothetical protein [Alphaproteobacteria bacterium]